MTLRYLLTFLAVVAGFTATVLMPKDFELRPARVETELPAFVDDWLGIKEDITVAEINVLAPDTEFSRRVYTNSSSRELRASLILSGHDLNNSIHRPERCMGAQGWVILEDDPAKIPMEGADMSLLPVHNLDLVRVVPLAPGATPYPDGSVYKTFALNTFFFVGAESVTASHYGRTLIDMMQRLTSGANQRWAFVMVMADYGGYVEPPDGLSDEVRAKVDKELAQNRKIVQKDVETFISELVPKILLPVEDAKSQDDKDDADQGGSVAETAQSVDKVSS